MEFLNLIGFDYRRSSSETTIKSPIAIMELYGMIVSLFWLTSRLRFFV